MGAGEAFFDTSVLMRLADGESGKAARAEELLAAGGVTSVQVLAELTAVARRTVGLSWTETREFLEVLGAVLEVVPLTLETHERGLELAERYQLQPCGGMIVAAAQLAGCRIVYSEDLHDGLVIDGLTIRNPYAGI